MSNFMQFHLLTAYPPSNVNRDDAGSPKTATIGGTNRIRISSQSLKRAWRTSEVFEQKADLKRGTRTKRIGSEFAYPLLIELGADESLALVSAKKIAGVFGKNKKLKKGDPMSELEIEQIAFVSPEEQEAIKELCQEVAGRNEEPSDKELKLLRKSHSAADLALFGRMLASDPAYNVEAAAQVAHAFTVHTVGVEDDYFTAVDDLNTHEVDSGSSHLGEREFASGLFYIYICVNMDLLKKNLSAAVEPEQTAIRTVQALIESAATISPSGMQNSFASRARASYILAEKGTSQPRSLAVAFFKPVSGGDILAQAIETIQNDVSAFDNAYGTNDERYELNVRAGKGTLRELLEFVEV